MPDLALREDGWEPLVDVPGGRTRAAAAKPAEEPATEKAESEEPATERAEAEEPDTPTTTKD